MITKKTPRNKGTIAKLLATEDIFVVYKQMETAYFDSKKRELGLPIWNDEDMTADISDLMTCHEIGHALIYSPRFWNIDYDGDGALDREYVPGYDGDCNEGDALRYYGPNAMAAWHSMGGSGGVPLEPYNQHKPASGCTHLDNSVFPEDINGAYLNGIEVFGLSSVALGMLEDSGYTVDYNNAIESEVNLTAVQPATN